jgi:hypothetical protein
VSVIIVIGGFLLWWFVVGLAKELLTEAKDRRDDRIMRAYLRAEDARAHRSLLAEIEARRRATAEELVRAAIQADGPDRRCLAVEIGPR